MARYKSIIEIKGSLGALSFYNSKFGLIVRSKGGPSRQQVLTKDSFVRTRENNSEFGHCSRAATAMLRSLKASHALAPSFKAMGSLTGLFVKIKNLDESSLRGARTLANGFKAAQAPQLLKEFAISGEATLESILQTAYDIRPDGSVEILGLLPKRLMALPESVNAVSFAVYFISPVGSEQNWTITRSAMKTVSSSRTTDIRLTPPVALVSGNTYLLCLEIIFGRLLKGEYYFCRSRHDNWLGIIGIIQ